MKKLGFLVLASLIAFSYLSLLAQEKDSPAQGQASQTASGHSAKELRWEGTVQSMNKDKSTLTVRNIGNNLVKTIHYDSSTKWVSQEHGSKKVNDIDVSQVHEMDRVICIGTPEKGEFHATLVSKRLTPH